jgi:hypothetical protein
MQAKPTTAAPSTTTTRPALALHLLGGEWIASCPTCGLELASGRNQALVEAWAAESRCDVCDG